MSERQALLDKPTTPLPKMQLFLLFFIRMTDPVAFNCIFPFVQEMLLDIGAVQDPEKVGYYAGVVSLMACIYVNSTLTVGRIDLFASAAVHDLPLGSSIGQDWKKARVDHRESALWGCWT